MAFHRRADDDPTLKSGLVALWFFFQRIRTSIAKKPYIFCDFSGERRYGPPVHPYGPAHVSVPIAYAQAPPLNANANVSSGATCQESLFC